MAQVSVQLPSMLTNLVKSERAIAVEAETVAGALESLFAAHPELRVHIYDEQQAIRQHVNCFLNETILRDGDLGTAVAEGDTVTILQAVSGGETVSYSTRSTVGRLVGRRRM